MIKIGLTGNIASGKSTVAKVWRKMGAKVIDVDELAHNLYRPRTKVWQQVVKAFGKVIVKADNTINRAVLREIVFPDKKKMKKLTRIMYPAIVKELAKQMAAAKSKIVVADMAVLFEAKAEKLFDKIVVVRVSQFNQLQRLTEERNLTREQAMDRINSMSFHGEKISACDYLLDGDQPLAEFRKAAQSLFQKIT
ncbi:MAG: dephospho-CoA kinase [bacterium]|nr:dephospho-CoA kinase [bacterium]MDD5353999.1 dephospho-CoA kinase [bacterium]MDD5756136.1 dephospho-CoA kinase [bacterium]